MLTLSSWRLITALGCTLASASGATLTISGSLQSDSDVGFVNFRVSSQTDVSLRRLSWGGTATDGSGILGGGFDPVLTLFDPSGLIYDQNDDGPTGSDSLLEVIALPAGIYTLAVSQFSNSLLDPSSQAGSHRAGMTREYCRVDGVAFLSLTTCEQRNRAWTVILSNVDEVPEPATYLLATFRLAGAFLKFLQFRRPAV